MSDKGNDLTVNTPDEKKLMILGIMGVLIVFFYAPDIYRVISEWHDSRVYRYSASDTLYFTLSQILTLAESYDASREHEVGWCMGINNDRVEKVIVGDIFTSARKLVFFACPKWSSGTIHYHLSGYPMLSEDDFKYFLAVDDKVMCVYANVLKCYKKVDNEIVTIDTEVLR